MSLKCSMLLLIAIAQVAPLSAVAQEYDFPTLNSIGRYLGVGYTCGGYHAARDGRFNVITNRHPAAHYRPGGLPPNRGYASPMVLPSPLNYVPPPHSYAPAPAARAPEPQASPESASPRPQWLEDYLQEEAQHPEELNKPAADPRANPTDADAESSPSDLLLEEDKATPATGISYSVLDSNVPAWQPRASAKVRYNRYTQGPASPAHSGQ